MKKITYLFVVALFALSFATQVNAATLNLTAPQDTYKIGDTFDMNVKIDSETESINGVQATIKFDPTLLEATKTDKTGSVFDFWLNDPEISGGRLSFVAASTAGYDGGSLQVLKINFKVKGAGVGNVNLSDAAITVADGSGSNVLSESNNLTVTLASSVGKTKPTQITRAPTFATGSPSKPVLSVSLYPDPTKWNNTSGNFFVSWKLPVDVSDVAIVLDKSATTTPSQSEGLFESKQFSALDDGIYYIHIRYKNNIGWGPVEHYKISNDTTPPSPFSIIFPNGQPTDMPMPTIVYKSTDSLSGIDRYEISVDKNAPIITKTDSFDLPLQTPGKHTLKISIYDGAGNAVRNSLDYEIISIEPPIITTVNKNVFAGEGGFFISGTANPKFQVRVVLKDKMGNIVHTDLKTPDAKGNWNTSIDTPLKKQSYQFEVATVDDRGAVSTVVKSEVLIVRDKPILTLGEIEITLTWFFILFVLIVFGAFSLGYMSLKFAENVRSLDSAMAGRDIENVFNLFKKDINTILSKFTSENLDSTQIMEVKMHLEKLSLQIDKMKEYTKEGVNDISNKKRFMPAFIRRIKNLLRIK